MAIFIFITFAIALPSLPSALSRAAPNAEGKAAVSADKDRAGLIPVCHAAILPLFIASGRKDIGFVCRWSPKALLVEFVCSDFAYSLRGSFAGREDAAKAYAELPVKLEGKKEVFFYLVDVGKIEFFFLALADSWMAAEVEQIH